MGVQKNILMVGFVVTVLLLSVPATSFGYWGTTGSLNGNYFGWGTTWSSNGKYVSMLFNYNENYGSTYFTMNSYTIDEVGRQRLNYSSTVISGTDKLGRSIKRSDDTSYKFLSGLGVRRINRTITGEYKSTNGYNFNEKFLLKYYFDSEGYWDHFTGYNKINGWLPGGENFKGNASYSNNQIFFGDSVFPVKKVQLRFYKYGVLKAKSTFTILTAYTRKGGLNRIQNSTLKTYTVFSNGESRGSTIKRYNYIDASGHIYNSKITGSASGVDKINNHNVYYKSSITMAPRPNDETIYYYKEIRTSSSKTLNKKLPYEAMLYTDLTNTNCID